MSEPHTTTSPIRRSAATEQLVLSHFTLARDHPVDDRIAAAAAAGIGSIGLFAGQYLALLRDGWSAGALHELLDNADVRLRQVEALSGWGAAQPSDAYRVFEREVWSMVDEFGATYVQAIGPYDNDISDAATRFGALCDRAAEHGATVGLEFLPFTNIVDADDARRIVEAADRPNGGVCVDVWHHVRGANDLTLIERLPSELIVGVQMSDGPRHATLGDYKDDCIRHRLPPGEGSFDLDGFVGVLLDLGVDVPWDLEVCNDNVWGERAADYVARCADGMRTVLFRHLDEASSTADSD
jgi:sugar phosphate isomerase/epimerase